MDFSFVGRVTLHIHVISHSVALGSQMKLYCESVLRVTELGIGFVFVLFPLRYVLLGTVVGCTVGRF